MIQVRVYLKNEKILVLSIGTWAFGTAGLGDYFDGFLVDDSKAHVKIPRENILYTVELSA